MRRIILFVGLSMGAALVVSSLARPDEPQDAGSKGQQALANDRRLPHEKIDLPSLIACGGCHETVYREWAETLHHRAWTNPNARAATGNFEKVGCRSCHSPQSVFLTGFERRPLYRDFNQADGVHCLSCHGLEDGVAAARTIEGAPCKPRFDEDFVSRDLCFPCHEPTHQAYTEYRTSDAFEVGLRCADCHMPQRTDRPGRSHGPHGGLSPEFVRRGFAWSCRRLGATLELTLRNRTGHKFPGEIPSRALVVKLEIDARDPLYVTLRRPGKTEPREDNRLAPDEERRLIFELPDSTTPVKLTLLWKPYALVADEDAFVLGRFSHPLQTPR